MVLRSQLTFDNVYLDWNNAPDVREFIADSIKRELVNEFTDKLKDNRTYIVELKKQEFIEDSPMTGECAIKQDLVCEKLIQCKNCRMNFPWCHKFRDELGGNGFCPYGKEIENA